MHHEYLIVDIIIIICNCIIKYNYRAIMALDIVSNGFVTQVQRYHLAHYIMGGDKGLTTDNNIM